MLALSIQQGWEIVSRALQTTCGDGNEDLPLTTQPSSQKPFPAHLSIASKLVCLSPPCMERQPVESASFNPFTMNYCLDID